MTRYLFDSGIMVDYLNKRNGVFERARQEVSNGGIIGTGIPILAELLAGIERSESRERNWKLLHTALPQFRLWPFDKDAAYEYGRLRALLLSAGRQMQSIDVMIAAIAHTLGRCVVVTKDSDLSAVPGLSVENWAS